jgi:hypothetical protein
LFFYEVIMAIQNTPPLSATYLNVQAARASAALPAAGAWDAAPTEMACPYFENATFNFTYTRGAAGGAFDFQIEASPYSVAANAPAGASEWITAAIYAGGAVVAGADTTSLVQRELESYASQGAAAEDFSFGPIDLGGTVERIRIRARESGAVGTPGTLQVEAVFA